MSLLITAHQLLSASLKPKHSRSLIKNNTASNVSNNIQWKNCKRWQKSQQVYINILNVFKYIHVYTVGLNSYTSGMKLKLHNIFYIVQKCSLLYVINVVSPDQFNTHKGRVYV